MNTAEAVKLADEVAGMVEQLKNELKNEVPRKEVFEDIYLLRRSVQRLEMEVREIDTDTLGDAC